MDAMGSSHAAAQTPAQTPAQPPAQTPAQPPAHTPAHTPAQTLSMLAGRLRRIEYAVHGDAAASSSHEEPPGGGAASARLRQLERTMKALAARSPAVSDVLQLHKHHPDLFHPTGSHTAPSSLPPASLAQLVLAHEALYKNTSAQLSALNDNSSIPESGPLAKLVTMQPRIEQLEIKQAEQARELAELRARSARVVERYYENGVLQMGERWTEWEERLKDCEILMRRKEAAKRREEGAP